MEGWVKEKSYHYSLHNFFHLLGNRLHRERNSLQCCSSVSTQGYDNRKLKITKFSWARCFPVGPAKIKRSGPDGPAEKNYHFQGCLKLVWKHLRLTVCFPSHELKTHMPDRFWAAGPEGQCPVGHRDEFPDVLRRLIKGLIRSIEAH